MPAAGRANFANVAGATEAFTPDFLSYLTALNDEFGRRIHALRKDRLAIVEAAVTKGRLPGPLVPSEARTTSWTVPQIPDELRQPGIEISGPASMTPMFINAVNPGPDGVRAEGDLDDDEDSAGHRLLDTVTAAHNRRAAVEGTLTYFDESRNRTYRVQPGKLPFFMHRERGLMLDEPEFTLDGKPVAAALLGTALTLFHAGRAQAERGQGIYFYLPKLESAAEVTFYRDLFATSQDLLPHLRNATIRAIILIESLPAAYQMEEMLFALGQYAAGLNAARWDLKASILEYVMADPQSVWPDRFAVDIKTTPFLSDIFRRLVAVCLKHGAVPIGGMATALPHRDEQVNQQAAAAIRADKRWEAEQGFIRAWVAHIYHMGPAAAPFKELAASAWRPTPDMAKPERYPVVVQRPAGSITVEGTRQNARVLLEYLEGWLGGRGAKGIDRLAGKPGSRPALMEDLATARISVAQIAQRIIHSAVAEDTEERHDYSMVKRILASETDEVVRSLGTTPDPNHILRYRNAQKIALRWIKNYTDFDFRSLGSYSRGQLAEIATKPDAI